MSHSEFTKLRNNIAELKKIVEKEIDNDSEKQRSTTLIHESLVIIKEIEKTTNFLQDSFDHSGSSIDD